MRRHVAAAIAALLSISLLSACGEPTTDEDRVKAALRATDTLSFRFVYTEERPSTDDLPADFTPPGVGLEVRQGAPPADKTLVQGVIEDDFRIKARVTRDGAAAYEKVISDDALAWRFLDPTILPLYVDRVLGPSVKRETDVPGVSVLDALKSQRWVIDTEGAPPTISVIAADRELGVDPVVDAITVFDYVVAAIDKALAVNKFNKDSLDPAYRTTEDPFPKPGGGSGVTRYDLRRPKLPAVGAISGSGRPDVAETKHFRKMAIYVKDGRVIQILERIEVTGKAVKDFEKYFLAFLREVAGDEGEQLAKEFKDDVADIRRTGGDKLLGRLLLTSYSLGARLSGVDPIVQRSMRMDIRDLGAKNRVELPAEDVVRGSLAVLSGAGRRPTAGGVVEGAPPGDPTGTTAPGATSPAP